MEMISIIREAERMRSNDLINEEMIAGEYISEGGANSPRGRISP